MTPAETELVLKHRFNLTGQRWGPDTVQSWAQALRDVDPADAKRALTALVRRGEEDLTVPGIRALLRAETRAEQATRREPRECECTPRKLCDHHRAIGLTAIADIRQRKADRNSTTPPGGDAA